MTLEIIILPVKLLFDIRMKIFTIEGIEPRINVIKKHRLTDLAISYLAYRNTLRCITYIILNPIKSLGESLLKVTDRKINLIFKKAFKS